MVIGYCGFRLLWIMVILGIGYIGYCGSYSSGGYDTGGGVSTGGYDTGGGVVVVNGG